MARERALEKCCPNCGDRSVAPARVFELAPHQGSVIQPDLLTDLLHDHCDGRVV
jgi:hypothetical protein